MVILWQTRGPVAREIGHIDWLEVVRTLGFPEAS